MDSRRGTTSLSARKTRSVLHATRSDSESMDEAVHKTTATLERQQ